MPVMSGFDATKILKSRPDLKNTPVIALTAAAMAGDRERTLAAGCDDYVSKPVDRKLLLERVRHWERSIGLNKDSAPGSGWTASSPSDPGEPVGAAVPAARGSQPPEDEEKPE